MVILLSNLTSALAAGMTVKFFPLFFQTSSGSCLTMWDCVFVILSLVGLGLFLSVCKLEVDYTVFAVIPETGVFIV